MSASAETLALLTSIDDRLSGIDTAIKSLARLLSPPEPADLDGQYGDPIVNAADPRDWTGDTMKGRRFSQCPPIYLDLLASRFDYFADKSEKAGDVTTSGNPRAPMIRKDAARARGWAARIRAGKTADPVVNAPSSAGFPSDEMMSGDDIKF